jgi:hypothetical protein
MTAKISLGLHISFVDAAPGGTKKQIGDVPGIQSLPLSDLGSRFVFL